MKYLSLFVLVILMSLSWQIFHEPAAITEETHMGLQDDLQDIITEYITENLPESKNIRFERMWTEVVKHNKVKASFIYSFDDSTPDASAARISINGFAMLNKTPGSSPNDDMWSFDELYILDNKIQFTQGVTITPQSSEE